MLKFLMDSASDCDKQTGSYDLFVPISITLDGREYHDGEDLDKQTFYQLLTGTDKFPQTSQPSPQVFLEHFQKIKDDGDELICFCLSSALSGTYQGACMAKEMVRYDKIYVIDTKRVSHLIGVMVEYAVRLRKKGCAACQIVEAVERLKENVCVLAGLDTLEYLKRGGRMSGAAAFVGTLAQVKPILTISSEGKVEVQGKAIGKVRAMQQIAEKVASVELDPDFPVLSLYSYGEENCAQLEKRLRENGIVVSRREQIGPTIGAHTGPGVYGVIFVTK